MRLSEWKIAVLEELGLTHDDISETDALWMKSAYHQGDSPRAFARQWVNEDGPRRVDLREEGVL